MVPIRSLSDHDNNMKDYTINGFNISGQISIASDINREPLLEEYELVIEAVDGGLPRKSNVTIVTVRCSVNHPPIIIEESTHMRIKENVKPGVFVGKVRAHDPDHNQLLMFYSDDREFEGKKLC